MFVCSSDIFYSDLFTAKVNKLIVLCMSVSEKFFKTQNFSVKNRVFFLKKNFF